MVGTFSFGYRIEFTMFSRFIRLCILLFACLAAAFGQDPRPECPTISVTGPAGITMPGEKFVFSGDLRGLVSKDLTYVWEVSGGKIVDGQGTLKISIEGDWKDGSITIVATLNVIGLPTECPKSDSEAAGLSDPPDAVLIDEFGKRPTADIEARFRKFFAELANNPNNQGYIINYGTDKEIAAHEKLIAKYVAFRNFDRSRITMIRGGRHESGTVFSKLYRVPPGAYNPAP